MDAYRDGQREMVQWRAERAHGEQYAANIGGTLVVQMGEAIVKEARRG